MMNELRKEIQRLKTLLENEKNPVKRYLIKEEINTNENKLNDYYGK